MGKNFNLLNYLKANAKIPDCVLIMVTIWKDVPITNFSYCISPWLTKEIMLICSPVHWRRWRPEQLQLQWDPRWRGSRAGPGPQDCNLEAWCCLCKWQNSRMKDTFIHHTEGCDPHPCLSRICKQWRGALWVKQAYL